MNMTETNAPKVLLLDDHPVILDGLAAHLATEGGFDIVSRCTTPEEAQSELDRTRPDVALVDVKIEGGFTFEFVRGASAAHPDLRFVFISGHEDDLFIEKAFESGAQGYVLKSEPLGEVVEAVRAALRGDRYVSPQILRRFPQLASTKPRDTVQTRLSMLTKREREVLQHVSQGRSAKEISEILKISTWTVTNHKANIMAKLDIHNQVGLTRFAVSTGLASL